MWKFYTPKIQILEIFPFTDEGWQQALEIEKRLIRPDLNNPLCLNENCSAGVSLKIVRNTLMKLHTEKTEDGKSAHAVYIANCSHEKKNAEGKSEHAVEMGRKGSAQTHRVKNEEGKSIHAIRVGLITMSEKDENGKSLHAVRVGNITFSRGTGCHAPEYKGKGAEVTNSQKWIDPDHPELGERSAPTLASMQKRRGYPHGKENRVRVG